MQSIFKTFYSILLLFSNLSEEAWFNILYTSNHLIYSAHTTCHFFFISTLLLFLFFCCYFVVRSLPNRIFFFHIQCWNHFNTYEAHKHTAIHIYLIIQEAGFQFEKEKPVPSLSSRTHLLTLLVWFTCKCKRLLAKRKCTTNHS